ncbi:hypothetical protein QVD17_19710 [Tagetes erecta]|uniref:Uncharacterized protein n=1 Tax=Tagetes erecta TaxID=13708 RepID=A0AAD8NXJ4_TARER|nr:hypothetical protein QVD17_19710 [Tagetes erecta]
MVRSLVSKDPKGCGEHCLSLRARCFPLSRQPLSTLKELEPVGLNKDIVDKALGFPTLKRPSDQSAGEDAGSSQVVKRMKLMVETEAVKEKFHVEKVTEPTADPYVDPDVHAIYDDADP